MISLADFDQAIIEKHGITERKLERVSRYVRLLQGDEAPTLRDIAVGGYYGSSALLHEVVELDILLEHPGRRGDHRTVENLATGEREWRLNEN